MFNEHFDEYIDADSDVAITQTDRHPMQAVWVVSVLHVFWSFHKSQLRTGLSFLAHNFN